MVLWTIQTKQAYEKLMQDGVLRTEEEYITLPECKDAYLWLIEQMKQKIGAPPAGVTYPIWAWYQWGSKRKRLDMRSHGRGWCAEKGTLIVLLTIDVPEQQVLLHDFDYWHHVLNNWAIEVPFDENAVYTQEEKEKSWNYIFDIACSFEEEERKNFYTQATFWELRKEWVIKAEHYISR